jgi:hypothetical protein
VTAAEGAAFWIDYDSIVPALDALLAERGSSPIKIRSQIAPKIGHGSDQLRRRSR